MVLYPSWRCHGSSLNEALFRTKRNVVAAVLLSTCVCVSVACGTLITCEMQRCHPQCAHALAGERPACDVGARSPKRDLVHIHTAVLVYHVAL
jgi:hypothetical protein